MRRPITSPHLRLALFSVALAILLATGSPELRLGLAYLGPFLLLIATLLADRYPGEKLLMALGAPLRRKRGASRNLATVTPATLSPRGGLLLALALAARPPPRGPAATKPLFHFSILEVSMLKRTTACCAMALALLIPAAAQAHVSVHPNTVPAGAFATLDIRVPGEEENAYAYKVDTLFPPGFTSVDTQNVPGWTTKVVTKKLAKPIQTDSGPISEEVSQVIWTGDKSVNGRLDNGVFMQFPLSVAIPENLSGKSLAFKTLESYSNGKVVHWIGAPNAEFPAPTINITAKGGVLQDVAGGEAGPTAGEVPGTEAAAPAASSSSGASKGLGIAALILGALGLIAG
ncbi:MAG: YcnI family protein, partial [Mycobacteriales bacterium]